MRQGGGGAASAVGGRWAAVGAKGLACREDEEQWEEEEEQWDDHRKEKDDTSIVRKEMPRRRSTGLRPSPIARPVER
jgi:hypothetical protein